MEIIKWSIKDIVNILKIRRANEFDGNIAVSGNRGDGKSTIINKILYRIDGFKPWKHQVYSRDDVVNLLKTEKYGLCWDDEAINTAYKRDFQNKGQQEMIKILTAYRDNFNIFASAIPNFFSLDKDLRDLYFLHIHVIERGIAVLHMPIQGKLYSRDRWDATNNAKIEEKWTHNFRNDCEFKPPFHKLSTFAGYLFFEDATESQKKLYKEIKKIKREKAFITEQEKDNFKETSFTDNLYQLIIDGKLTQDGLMQICFTNSRKYSIVSSTLNRLLKDKGHTETLKTFLRKDVANKSSDKVMPSIPSNEPITDKKGDNLD